ncbi:hypothetical protein F5B20DRAFT_228990 [Whalleya microplaca]|nr:hypothetical protein F5B20DRAFT_228990 [Whalleya microplaca]
MMMIPSLHMGGRVAYFRREGMDGTEGRKKGDLKRNSYTTQHTQHTQTRTLTHLHTYAQTLKYSHAKYARRHGGTEERREAEKRRDYIARHLSMYRIFFPFYFYLQQAASSLFGFSPLFFLLFFSVSVSVIEQEARSKRQERNESRGLAHIESAYCLARSFWGLGGWEAILHEMESGRRGKEVCVWLPLFDFLWVTGWFLGEIWESKGNTYSGREGRLVLALAWLRVCLLRLRCVSLVCVRNIRTLVDRSICFG